MCSMPCVLVPVQLLTNHVRVHFGADAYSGTDLTAFFTILFVYMFMNINIHNS